MPEEDSDFHSVTIDHNTKNRLDEYAETEFGTDEVSYRVTIDRLLTNAEH